MSVLVCSMKLRLTPFSSVLVVQSRQKDDVEKFYQNYHLTLRTLVAECEPETAGLADQCFKSTDVPGETGKQTLNA